MLNVLSMTIRIALPVWLSVGVAQESAFVMNFGDCSAGKSRNPPFSKQDVPFLQQKCVHVCVGIGPEISLACLHGELWEAYFPSLHNSFSKI